MGTAYNNFKLFEATGEVDHKSQPKLDSHHELYLIGMILDCPTLQLLEIASKVVGIWYNCNLMQTPSKLQDDPEVQDVVLRKCLDLRM